MASFFTLSYQITLTEHGQCEYFKCNGDYGFLKPILYG